MAELGEILKAIDDGALEEWTNARTLARGRGYCDRVGELGFVHGVLTAKVKGTCEYITNVYLSDGKGMESVCSCPVHHRCKHAVALMLAARALLNRGIAIRELDREEWLLPRNSDTTSNAGGSEGTIPMSALGKTSSSGTFDGREQTNSGWGNYLPIYTTIKPSKKYFQSRDYSYPVPENPGDPERRMPHAEIKFPDNQFQTSIWPAVRCRTAEEVRQFLSNVPLVGREIFRLRTFGRCVDVNERHFLEESGKDFDYDEYEECWQPYLGIEDGTMFDQSVSARYVVQIDFKRGGSFEIDGEIAPDFYLAMNQIGFGVEPEMTCNVDMGEYFANVSERVIASVEVVSSFHDRDPYYGRPYETPMELADEIVFWLDDGHGLRFRTECSNLLVDMIDSKRMTCKLPWKTIRRALYNDADVFVDQDTGYVSESLMLGLGRKGEYWSGNGRCLLYFDDGRMPTWKTIRASASIMRKHSMILALAAYAIGYRGSGDCMFEMTEWNRLLNAADEILEAPVSSPATLLGQLMDRDGSARLLRDVRKWTNWVNPTGKPVRVSNLWSAR